MRWRSSPRCAGRRSKTRCARVRRTSMTDALLAATFPVFKVDGSVVGGLARDVVRLEVEEGTDGLRTLTATFQAIGLSGSGDVEPLLHLDGSDLDFGKRLEVSIGAPGDERVIFKGLI